MDIKIKSSKKECYICKRTSSEIKTLFEKPINDRLQKRFKELSDYYNEVIRYINFVFSPIKNWLYELKSALVNNKYLNFSVQTIITEYENLKPEIPKVKNFLDYFNVDISNGYYDRDERKLKELLNEFEEDLEKIEHFLIPKRVQKMLNLDGYNFVDFQFTLKDDENERSRGYYDDYDDEDDQEDIIALSDIKKTLKQDLIKYERRLKEDGDDYYDSMSEEKEVFGLFDNFNSLDNEDSLKSKKSANSTLAIKQKSALISLFKMKNRLLKLMKGAEPMTFNLKPMTFKRIIDKYDIEKMVYNYYICPICSDLIQEKPDW